MSLNIDQWLTENTVDLQGRVVVITGATGGLGRHVVRDLLKANAKIVMLERSMKVMNEFSEQLHVEFPEAEIDCIEIDLNQIKSV
ncbi:MAG: SDR family NAD(P)-dependent oxidoreductase, partial [Clostridia bacterium]|nr:SDR family NAD(P)-dependent oxidoreductase [Clostridia bacterium]